MNRKLLLRTTIWGSLLAALMLLFVACGSTTVSTDANVVHMNEKNFVQSSITLKKGQDLTLVDDASVVHIIENGYWDQNGNQRVETTSGAPKVDMQVAGNSSVTVGPFTTAGTFHLYCTVHPDMNLVVIVR